MVRVGDQYLSSSAVYYGVPQLPHKAAYSDPTHPCYIRLVTAGVLAIAARHGVGVHIGLMLR